MFGFLLQLRKQKQLVELMPADNEFLDAAGVKQIRKFENSNNPARRKRPEHLNIESRRARRFHAADNIMLLLL